MIICPVCKKPTGQYWDGVKMEYMPLYQIGYPGDKEYLTQRCLSCFEKMEARRAERGHK